MKKILMTMLILLSEREYARFVTEAILQVVEVLRAGRLLAQQG